LKFQHAFLTCYYLTLSARIVQYSQLSRFLEMRDITPAVQMVRHWQSIHRTIRVAGMVEMFIEIPCVEFPLVSRFGLPTLITTQLLTLYKLFHDLLTSYQGLNVAFTGATIFTSALVLALAYTSSQDDRGGKTTFFIVTIPSVLVPYAMLFITLIKDGFGAVLIQGTGLVAAHLHDFLTRLWPSFGGGRNLLPTPKFVTRLFQSTEATIKDRSYGTAFTPAQKTPSTATGASAGGVLPESWRSRGSGHRLGGE